MRHRQQLADVVVQSLGNARTLAGFGEREFIGQGLEPVLAVDQAALRAPAL